MAAPIRESDLPRQGKMLLTTREAAALVGVSASTMETLRRQGTVRFIDVLGSGRGWRTRREWLDEWLATLEGGTP
jgi:excisionase family DNA binding protein